MGERGEGYPYPSSSSHTTLQGRLRNSFAEVDIMLRYADSNNFVRDTLIL